MLFGKRDSQYSEGTVRVPSTMNVLDFGVLNGSPGDKTRFRKKTRVYSCSCNCSTHCRLHLLKGLGGDGEGIKSTEKLRVLGLDTQWVDGKGGDGIAV